MPDRPFVLPNRWHTARLGVLEAAGHLWMRNGFPCGSHNQEGIGIPQLRPMNVSNDGQIDLWSVKSIEVDRDVSGYLVREGDVIFNNTNSRELVGKTALWDRPSGRYVLSNHMTILRFAKASSVEPYFIARYFHYLWLQKYFEGVRRQHVNQASISLERLRNMEIPLPPLSEQKTIAHTLQAVQRAKDARQRELVLERERKTALIEYLFTHGVHSEPRKQTEIGMMPERWQVVRLQEVCKSSIFGPRFSASLYDRLGNVAVIRTTDMDDDGNVDFSTVPLAKLSVDRLQEHLLRSGDLMITRSGTVGITSVFRSYAKPVVPGAFLIRFRLSDEIEPHFLAYYLNSSTGRARTKQLASGAIQQNLTSTALRTLKLPLPTREEQRQITDAVLACDRKSASLKHEDRLMEELFRAMLDELMTGRLSTASLLEP